MAWLVFIDTNIFLDFYRMVGGGVGLSLLGHIDRYHDRIITSNQVEMEYKKNRQRVILKSLSSLKPPDWGSLTPPSFLADAQPVKAIGKSKKEIDGQQKKLRKRIEAILRNPSTHDPVYKVLQRLFKDTGPLNLSRDKKIRLEIRSLAWKRFVLGYPPRKDDDLCMGDAINWEWLIHCASESGKNLIVVSRDTDYGIIHNKDPILNDWLSQEFKERVSRKRKILLTHRLTQAFKMAAITVTRQEEKEEDKLINRVIHEFVEGKSEESKRIREWWYQVVKETSKDRLSDTFGPKPTSST